MSNKNHKVKPDRFNLFAEPSESDRTVMSLLKTHSVGQVSKMTGRTKSQICKLRKKNGRSV